MSQPNCRRFVGVGLLVTLCCTGIVRGQTDDIRWRNERVVSVPVSDTPTAQLVALTSATEARHVLVRLARPVTASERTALRDAGVRLLRYVDRNAWFATLSPTTDAATAVAAGPIVGVRGIDRGMRVHSALDQPDRPGYMSGSGADGIERVALYARFHEDVSAAEQEAIAAQYGATIRSRLAALNTLVLEMPAAQLQAFGEEDALQWAEPPLPALSENNDSNRAITQVEQLQMDAPYGLDGTGVTAMVFDAGVASDVHPDFGGRMTVGEQDGASSHATHVAGTVGGNGLVSDGQFRGMAPNVRLISYAFTGNINMPTPDGPFFLYSDPSDILDDYTEAIATYGIDVVNNSIGTNACRNGFPCFITGNYGITAALIDEIVRGAAGAPLRVVWSNGNERSCSRCRNEGHTTEDGYHSTAPPSCAKNHITVGALNSNDDSMTNFSSWGPCDDGRIKPDISGPGCQATGDFGVTSCSLTGTYFNTCGTSMSAPTVTGICALILQDFRTQYPNRPEPVNATFKALLAHNAADIFEVGPDYRSGYGSVRAKDTIDFLRTGNFVEDIVGNAEMTVFDVWVADDDTELKVTLAWDDAPAAPNALIALVNDLDLRVFDPQGAQYFPWTLNPDDPAAPAVQTEEDHLNNIEQVVVNAPAPGLWRVEVLGFNVPEGPQAFSITAGPRLSFDCNDNDIPDEQEITQNPDLDCDMNFKLDECEVDCDGDGLIDACELLTGEDTDCNGNGIPDSCEPEADCNDNGIFDPCDIVAGTLLDCNDNFIPDSCGLEPDCNENGVPDDCDIESGVETDCNENGVPDSCEFADCNNNGVNDTCDILLGFSNDCNDNDIPDDCDPVDFVYVDAAAPGDPSPNDSSMSDPLEDGTQAHPFDALQEAIDAAGCNVNVFVADGTYSGPGNNNLNFNGSPVAVRSMNGPANCIIDLDGSVGFTIAADEGPGTVIEGLTIRNGVGSTGAAIICRNGTRPVVRNCVFEENDSLSGGAAIHAISQSKPLVLDCTFRANTSRRGVVYLQNSNANFDRCRFEANGARAFYMQVSSPTISRTIIRDAETTVDGGVIFATSPSEALLRYCLIEGNHTTRTGGVVQATTGSVVRFENCTIRDNAADAGPGLATTLSGEVVFHNCILWNTTSGNETPAIQLSFGSEGTVRFCDIEGGLFAISADLTSSFLWEDNIDSDPRFDVLAGTGYTLHPASPAINAGDPLSVPLAAQLDLDGDPMIVGGRIDMGADEFATFAFGDTNCDDVINTEDIEAFVTALVNPQQYALDYPDCGPILADINGDGRPSVSDINAFVELILGQ